MKNFFFLAVMLLALWAWAVTVALRERRPLEAAGWALCGVLGAGIFAGRADGLPLWGKLVLVGVFLSLSVVLSLRQMRRRWSGH